MAVSRTMDGFRCARIQGKEQAAELFLYDEIGPSWYGLIGADMVIAALEELGDVEELTIRINSPGGDVFEGVAIYNAIARHKAFVAVEIDGLAASIASVISMAGDQITIAGNAMMMIHQAWTLAFGNADELEKTVVSLRQIDGTIVDTYDARTGQASSRDQIEEWMLAETWMTAGEAVERGFADETGPLKEAPAAAVPEGRYRNTPEHLVIGDRPTLAIRQRRERPTPPADRPESGPGLRYLPAIAARIADARRRNAA